MCCRWCGAKMWLGERVVRSGSEGNVEFSLRCMKGKVHLPHLQKPPKLLYNLLCGDHPKSKHYLDNIRAYNLYLFFTRLNNYKFTLDVKWNSVSFKKKSRIQYMRNNLWSLKETIYMRVSHIWYEDQLTNNIKCCFHFFFNEKLY